MPANLRFNLQQDTLLQQQPCSSAVQMEYFKNMCDYIIGLRQPLLQWMRSQQAHIKGCRGRQPDQGPCRAHRCQASVSAVPEYTGSTSCTSSTSTSITGSTNTSCTSSTGSTSTSTSCTSSTGSTSTSCTSSR